MPKKEREGGGVKEVCGSHSGDSLRSGGVWVAAKIILQRGYREDAAERGKNCKARSLLCWSSDTKPQSMMYGMLRALS